MNPAPYKNSMFLEIGNTSMQVKNKNMNKKEGAG